MNKNIATAYVRFVSVPGGKRRPVFVIKETKSKIFFFDITTKFDNKSSKIQKWYFEILDYTGTGLRKHSWIDTIKMYSLDKNLTEVKYIGKLSDNDVLRLKLFISKLKN